jgi:hypothetical protein
MQIDTTNATITFKSGEGIDPINLRSAADAVGAHMTVFVDLDLPQWELDLITPFTPRVTKVESYTKPGTFYYVIEMAPSVFTCTCPDFIHHRAVRSQWCKHVKKVQWGV